MSLSAIQAAFKAAIYEDSAETLAGLVKRPQQRSALEGISVYRNNTHERLKHVLAQIFPVCKQLVGERCFEQLAELYIADHPCGTHDLESYGGNFPLTVSRVLFEQPALRSAVPYLMDMARIEWLMQRAYFAGNRTHFDYEAFAKLSERETELVRFELQQDVSIVAVEWPVAAVWAMHQPGKTVTEFSIAPGNEHYLVERPRYQPELRVVSEPLFQALSFIRRGDSLRDLVTAVPSIQTILSHALQNNWIGKYTLTEHRSLA
jgi:hypothetical protein